jgi:Histidine kinase-, DNA gyrase B-, and HSP90-like ATPase
MSIVEQLKNPFVAEQLNGFDPLAEGLSVNPNDRSVFEEATRRVVQNILKSYTGYFDLFSELLQNSLDAIDKKIKGSHGDCVPQLWIHVDIANRTVRIVDNGSGMSFDEVRFCFRPNVSFKNRKEARGHKGVGATFLAYGFGLIRLSTKTPNFSVTVRLAGGRQWSDDLTGAYPRPKLELESFEAPELAQESSGTAVEIQVNQGQRPDLGWWNASTANQWYQILRMRTPLGGVYLSGEIPPKVRVTVSVNDYANNETKEVFDFVEYPYPHELSEVLPKVRSYDEIRKALSSLEGDSSKIPQELRNIDAFYGIWTAPQLVEEDSPFAGQKFLAEQEELIRRHDVAVYGCFLSTAKTWRLYQQEILRIRKEPLILKGGLLIASDHMVQGDLGVIPLTSTIGYQANTHVIVHFRDGNPDMGRKVFQPELKSLAEDLAKQVVNIFKRYLYLMREDTGVANLANETDTYHWLEEKKKYRTENPLEFAYDGKHLAYACRPNAEQDVIAIFHELVT